MPSTTLSYEPPAASGTIVPSGYLAIPVSPNQKSTPLRVCALVREAPDPVAGHLVMLRDASDARVFLGAVVDAGNHVHEWVELWVQCLDGISNTLEAWRESLTNSGLDARWQHHAQSLASSDLRLIVQTGWEFKHPAPVWLDLAKREPVVLVDAASNEVWRLCQDDSLLAGAHLPAYATSLHRYLYVPKQGAGGPFIPVTSGAPAGPATVPLSSVIGSRPELVPFNPGGGLVLVQLRGDLSVDAFLDLLGGGAVAPLPAVPAGAPGADPARLSDGWLFIGQHGKWGRLLESFHLKLRVLADAVAAVRSRVEQTQQPLLNLAPDRFQVRVGKPGPGLPSLWTAATTLAGPGDAIELPVGPGGTKYFLPGRPLGPSVYRPGPTPQPGQGSCSLRVSRFLPDADGTTIMEGTLSTQERVEATARDLVRLRVNPGNGRLDLYARFEDPPGAAAGERRFRSLGYRLDPAADAQLRAAANAPIQGSSFEVLPVLSTPWDLYALGVLAVRALLVNNGTTLPTALDEVLSLARRIADPHDDSAPLRLRVRSIFESDARWVQSLGPHRLTSDGVTPEKAFELVPAELWWDVLAMLVRMFPGVGPDSTCADFGDASAGGLHRVFDPTDQDLRKLLIRTRSLIFIDWRYNREVNAVIRATSTGAVSAVSGAAGAPAVPAVPRNRPAPPAGAKRR